MTSSWAHWLVTELTLPESVPQSPCGSLLTEKRIPCPYKMQIPKRFPLRVIFGLAAVTQHLEPRLLFCVMIAQ